MSLSALVYDQLKDVTRWDLPFLNTIFCTGNSLYPYISISVKKVFCCEQMYQNCFHFRLVLEIVTSLVWFSCDLKLSANIITKCNPRPLY